MTYKQLKRLVQKHKVRSHNDYLKRRHEFCPESISSPQTKFKEQWEGWHIFLGKEQTYSTPPKEGFFTYQEAKEILQKHNFKGTRRDYNKICKQISLRLPTQAQGTYKDNWISWSEYLNNNNIANDKVEFVSFDRARELLKPLKLQGSKHYAQIYKKLSEKLPAAPMTVYKQQWKGWIHYLSKTRKIKTPPKPKPALIFTSYESAQKICIKANIHGQKQYIKHYKRLSKEFNTRLPATPDIYYKKHWKSWKDFLSTKMFNYRQAQKVCLQAKIKNREDYDLRRKQISPRLPSAPYTRYKKTWHGWEVFLKQPKAKNVSYKKAKNACIQAGIKSSSEFNKRYKTLGIKVPSNPNRIYPEWVSWRDFLNQ